MDAIGIHTCNIEIIQIIILYLIWKEHRNLTRMVHLLLLFFDVDLCIIGQSASSERGGNADLYIFYMLVNTHIRKTKNNI